MTDIASPCIRQCCLDDNNVCLGCFRTMDEICKWNESPHDVKLTILTNAEQRQAIHLRLYKGRTSAINTINK